MGQHKLNVTRCAANSFVQQPVCRNRQIRSNNTFFKSYSRTCNQTHSSRNSRRSQDLFRISISRAIHLSLITVAAESCRICRRIYRVFSRFQAIQNLTNGVFNWKRPAKKPRQSQHLTVYTTKPSKAPMCSLSINIMVHAWPDLGSLTLPDLTAFFRSPSPAHATF